MEEVPLLVMSLNVPPTEPDRFHWYDGMLMLPSGSVTDAMSVDPPDSVPEIVTVPGSSTFVRLMVTVMEASVAVFALPAEFLLSRTFTVTV